MRRNIVRLIVEIELTCVLCRVRITPFLNSLEPGPGPRDVVAMEDSCDGATTGCDIAMGGIRSYAVTAESIHARRLDINRAHRLDLHNSTTHTHLPPHTRLTLHRGKGTPRRKVKKVHKTAGADDKKLQATLKKMNVQPIQAIEEVNMFKEDGNVIHFANPRGKLLPLHVEMTRPKRIKKQKGPGGTGKENN